MTLTPAQKDAIDEMVQRRMKNTNETEEVAAEHIIQFFEGRLLEKLKEHQDAQ
ncbi:hypothetical protein N9026_00180 [bacterium]|nr:hypothetical protein [bacterium]